MPFTIFAEKLHLRCSTVFYIHLYLLYTTFISKTPHSTGLWERTEQLKIMLELFLNGIFLNYKLLSKFILHNHLASTQFQI